MLVSCFSSFEPPIIKYFGESYGAAVCGTVSADITSANTVGFNTINIEGGKWYMVAPQFEDVANAGGETIDLLKTMTFEGFKAVTYANRLSGSKISIYNSSTGLYTTYY